MLHASFTPPGSSSSLPCGKDGWFSLLSCTTIYVYVILSKNASLSRSRGMSLVCGCKGTHFPRHGQNKKHFFCKKTAFQQQSRYTLACAQYIMVYKENRVVREKPIHPVRSRKDAPLGRMLKIAFSGGTILATNILLYSTPRYETIPSPRGFGCGTPMIIGPTPYPKLCLPRGMG